MTEDGAAPVEFLLISLFAIVLLFGVVQVAFALYGRNVVAASAHEAARAAIEVGGDATTAESLARDVVARSAGGLARDFDVQVASTRTSDRVIVRVRVSAHLDPPGPVPSLVPVSTSATAVRERTP